MPRPASTRVEVHRLAQVNPGRACAHCVNAADRIALVVTLDGRPLRSIPLCGEHAALWTEPTS